MKTAQEWLELYMKETGYTTVSDRSKERIKEIQLDAWKQGMRDALEHISTGEEDRLKIYDAIDKRTQID